MLDVTQRIANLESTLQDLNEGYERVVIGTFLYNIKRLTLELLPVPQKVTSVSTVTPAPKTEEKKKEISSLNEDKEPKKPGFNS